jgi:erythritol transport system ATP-binding protein
MTADKIALKARGIVKEYGVTRALKGVDFDIRAGKVTTLFGENGAGKSTLMKILSGVEQPTSGTMELNGQIVSFASTTDAVRNGISIIHQELNLAPNLSVRDNIFMGREVRGKLGVDFRYETEATQAVLDRLEEPIAPNTLVADLRLGQQQIVEIARALSTDASILIMDEPTSALSNTEVEVLFRVIEELKARDVAIVYISHHLEEAIHVSDYCVVFRDGELVATAEAKDVDLAWVVSNMVGREADFKSILGPSEIGRPVLEIENYTVPDASNPDRNAVESVSLKIHEGEIVCIFGLMGAGRTELLESIAGRVPSTSGKAYLNGEDVTNRTISQRIRNGLALVPEDRQRDGLVQSMSVGQNLSIAQLGKLLRGWFVDEKKERSEVEKQIADVRVKTTSPDAPITSLSGGNQQKVVIGKILMTRPTAILLDEPTRGIDVGAKAEVFSLLVEQAKKGLAVLFATSEIGEALYSCNRILVMRRGHLVAEFSSGEATREKLMAAANAETMSKSGGNK